METTQTSLPAFENKEQIQNFINDWWTVIWVDTDTQFDFVRERWALYVPARPEVIQNISALLNSCRVKIWSIDCHTYDSWEFKENWWIFPPHCIKWSSWCAKIEETQNNRTRFIPMSNWNLVIWENVPQGWNRIYGPEQFAEEILLKWVTWIFEKEVYSLFANPNADPFIRQLVETAWWIQKVLFAVIGYCTGWYCADEAAWWLNERGYNTAIIEDACAPLNISQSWTPQNWFEVTRAEAKNRSIKILPTSFFIN